MINTMKDVEFKPVPFEFPEDKEEVSFTDKVNALVNQNVTFAKRLSTPYYGSIPEEDYSFNSDKSKMLLNEYNVSPEDYDKYINIASTNELETKLKYHKSIEDDAKIVDNMGIAGIAGSFVVGALDPAGWVIGGAAGKAAQMGANYYKLANKGIRITQGAAGAVGGVGSVAALEYSLDGEASDEALAINGILGFGIGFGTAGGLLSKPTADAIENTAKYGVEASPYKKIDMMAKWMYSSAERAKASDNPLMRELGYKTSRTMRDTGLQEGTTANDMLAEYNQINNIFKEEFDNHRKDYKKKYGKEFSKEDEALFNRATHEIDNEYTRYKDDIFNTEVEQIKSSKLTEIENKYKAEYENAKTPEDKTKLTKARNKEIKQLEEYRPEGDELKAINAKARANGKQKIKELIDSKPEHIRPFLNSFNKMTTKFANEIKDTNLHGMKDDIDDSWYASRSYDVDKIDANPEGAVIAFKEGILSNIKQITDDIEIDAERMARGIVNNISQAKADYNAFDADISVVKNAINETKIKSSNLKGRKLKIDASKVTDFMMDDIIHSTTSYSRRVGGELATKKSLGIDDVDTIDKLIKDKNIVGKDKELLTDMVSRIKGTSEIDPNSNSIGSRIVRGFNQINYINFGGWFGVNTLTDLSNIVNDFGLSRTMRYVTKDLIEALPKGDNRQSKRLARTLGLASESLTNDRAVMMGGESYGLGSHFRGEKQLQWMSNKMSQLSGMNMTIDFMDRTVSMASLDYILTHNMNNVKFQKNMNRLGLSSDDIIALRKSGMAKTLDDGLHDINFDVLDVELSNKVQRAIKRAARDTVLRANEIDSPEFLTEVLGSRPLAKALFQFIRFPVVAYNKLGIKMKENFDVADAMVATITASAILTLTNQAKDVGKEKPRFDLTTKEGIKNNTIAVVERLPHLSVVSLPQSYVDVLGRIGSASIGEDYKGRPETNLGITVDRIRDIGSTGGNLLSFKPKDSDILTATSFVPFGNLPYLQPFKNMFRDEVKGTKEPVKSQINKEDIERYLSGE